MYLSPGQINPFLAQVYYSTRDAGMAILRYTYSIPPIGPAVVSFALKWVIIGRAILVAALFLLRLLRDYAPDGAIIVGG